MSIELIRGKVAQVLSSREVVINIGTEQGVTIGMHFDILDPNGEDILDPDSGEVLGSLNRPKVRVQVVQVKEKLSVVSTYKKKTVNIGGMGGNLLSGVGDFANMLLPPKYVTKYETIKATDKTWESIKETESYVKIGDPVLQVIPAHELEDLPE